MSEKIPKVVVPAGVAASVASHPEVLRGRRPQGQVLVYAGHVPLSLFVVMTGKVRVEHPSPDRWIEEFEATPERPLLTPAPDALGQTARATVSLAEDSDVLFVPRSIVTSDPSIVAALSEPAFLSLSLRVERT